MSWFALNTIQEWGFFFYGPLKVYTSYFTLSIKEIDVNVAYRWFIGYSLTEPIPHFSTFGKNYARRFKGTNIFENIFIRILKEANDSGFIDASSVFIDGTHIKASANRNKKEKVTVTKPIKQYREELEQEIQLDRKNHDKKPIKKMILLQNKRLSVKVQQIRKVAYLWKVSMNVVLPTWQIRHVIVITLS